jgi:hypothetical protein
VNRRVLFVTIAVCVFVTAIVFLILLWPSSEEPEVAVVAPRAPATPVPPPRAVPATPATEAPARAPRRVEEPSENAPAAPAEPIAPPAAEPSPALGSLRIETDVPGAQVFLDREFIGVAPITADNVTPGTHQLNVSAEGYDGIAMPIEVTPGSRDLVLRFREVRLNSAIDVVHRHGVGSCRGRLIATPAGIVYETSNKNDAFSAPLLDLETFEVDYLAKNIRVRLPKGRQFNFTDPDGNADRLFVFHRDVERARERLRKGDTPAGH